MTVARHVIADLLWLFLALLIFRLIMEYVFVFARDFRPRGAFAIVLEIVYTVTDPPLKALRRVLPPLRIGNFALDMAFLVLFLVVSILANVLSA